MQQKRTTNLRPEVCLMTILENKTIRRMKLATIVSGRKKRNMTLYLVKTGTQICCYFAELALTCFLLGRVTFFKTEAIVASFLLLIVLF